MPILNKIFTGITWPIRKLWELIQALVGGIVPASWSGGALAFGGVGSLVLFLAGVVFVAVNCIVAAIRGDFSDVMTRVIFNTTMGSFYALFVEGFSVNPAMLVAVGFSGCLASTCMKSAEDIPWFVWIPYCIVFVAMSAILASYLTPVFESVGNWGWDTLRGLWQNKGGSFFPKLGRIIGLLFLGYFALVCLVMVIREYYACLCFGSITLAAIMVVMMIIQLVTGTVETGGTGSVWENALGAVLIFGSMIFVEYVRERYESQEV